MAYDGATAPPSRLITSWDWSQFESQPHACFFRMLKKLSTWVVILACVPLFAAVEQAQGVTPEGVGQPPAAANDAVQEKRVVIRFVTADDFPPFNYLDDEGVLTGFNVDLARAICLEVGAACDIKVRPWDELFLTLRRNDADAVIAAHKVTAEAIGEVEFTDRYMHTPGRFVTRTDVPKAEIEPYTLDGVAIGVARGTAHEAFLRAFFRDSRVQAFENPELAREALQQKKVDYVFDDAISLSFWLNGTLSRQCCEFRGGPFLEPKFFGDGLAIAVPKNDPQIKALINQALTKLRETGRLEEIVQRYFPYRLY